MKEYIKPLDTYQLQDRYGNITGEGLPSDYEVMDKINELIHYLNSAISVGLFPIPDRFKEDGK